MLDQFRQDMSGDSNDMLNDNRFQMSRKKLVFTLTGAALALVLFLFMIGAFRNESDNDLVASSNDPEALQVRIQELTARVEKLENASKPLVALDATTTQNPSPELAALVNDQALKQFISDNTSPEAMNFSGEDARPEPTTPAEVRPVPTPVPTPKAAATRSYTVKKGDTLSKISQTCYGTSTRWKQIYEANRDRISNINQLKVGTQLVIPEATK
jgi:nucleoid-associated protein YgaU